MLILIILIIALSAFGIVAALREIHSDGYHPVPTRTEGQEMLTRYR